MTGMWIRYGEVAAPTAVVLPGSGSTAEFVARAFAGPVLAAGYALATADPPRAAGDPAEEWCEALDDLPSRPALVGGVSLGAHAAARWAARRPGATDGLLLVMPAWTGAPDGVAAVSASTADELEASGVDAVLTRLRRLATGAGSAAWVLTELERAWRHRGKAALVAELRGVAASPGPTEAELARIDIPAGLVALAGDPLHPEAVARRWASALPRASLETVHHTTVAADRAALGTAALRALAPSASR
jgi:pimeloyl-ACP methyl ester carboxylesterase